MTKEMFYKILVVSIIVVILISYRWHRMSQKNQVLEEENDQMKRLLAQNKGK
jgi:uncharacterized membrane protein